MFDWRGLDWLDPCHYQDPAALSKGKSGTHFQVKLAIAGTTFLNVRMRYCTWKVQNSTPRKHLGSSRKLKPAPLHSKSMFLFDLAHSRRVPLFCPPGGGLFTATSCFSVLKGESSSTSQPASSIKHLTQSSLRSSTQSKFFTSIIRRPDPSKPPLSHTLRDIKSLPSFSTIIITTRLQEFTKVNKKFTDQRKQPTSNKMSAQNEGRQSPEPERQTGAQQQDAPSHGQGVNEESNNKEESKSQLEVCLYCQ